MSNIFKTTLEMIGIALFIFVVVGLMIICENYLSKDTAIFVALCAGFVSAIFVFWNDIKCEK